MFTPPEIPLSGYSPPQTDAYLPSKSSSSFYPHQYDNAYAPPPSDVYRAPSDAYYPPAASPYQQPAAAPYKASSAPIYQPSSGPQYQSPTQPPSFKKIDPSTVYSQQGPVQNFTPKPFNPSPIAQEKLAIFEPERQYQPPVIRRPLTTPNQRVRNVSPAPFAGGPHLDSYQNAPWLVHALTKREKKN